MRTLWISVALVNSQTMVPGTWAATLMAEAAVRGQALWHLKTLMTRAQRAISWAATVLPEISV